MLTNDLAMVMGMAGDGYAPESLSHDFFQQLLGTSPNVSLLVEYEDFKEECQAPGNECAPAFCQRPLMAFHRAGCSCVKHPTCITLVPVSCASFSASGRWPDLCHLSGNFVKFSFGQGSCLQSCITTASNGSVKDSAIFKVDMQL